MIKIKKPKGVFVIFVTAIRIFAAPVDLQLGARPQAMGGAFTALADDANAVVWNPACLTKVKVGELGFMHGIMSDFSGVNIDFLSYAQPQGTSGVGFSWLNVGADLKSGENESTSRMSENTFTLAYGVSPKKNFSLGMALKRLTLSSEVGGGGGLGFDFGSYYKINRQVSFALVLRNVATDIKDEYFPMNMRFGIAGRFMKGKINTALDVDTKQDIDGKEGTTTRLHAGIEGNITGDFSLRAGFDNGSPAAGFGVNVRTWKLDYAWLNNETLGAIHRVSAIYSFKPYEEKARPAKERRPARKKKKVKKISSKNLEKYYNRGRKYYKKGKYDKAIAEFRKIIKINPEYKRVSEWKDKAEEKKNKEISEVKKKYYISAMKAYDAKKYSRAKSYFLKILKLDPGHTRSKKMIEKCDEYLKKKKSGK